VRDAAYAMLTDADRMLGHKLAGEWLANAGETDALVLAEHYERGGAHDKAAFFYLRAAEQALRGNDLASALDRARRGGTHASGELRGRLHLVETEVLAWRGEHVLARASAEHAMRELEAGGPEWCEAAGQLAEACGRLGDHGPLAGLGASLLDAASSREHIVACVRASAQLLFAGVYGLARKLIDILPETGDPILRAWIDDGRSVVALFDGDFGTYAKYKQTVAAGFAAAGDQRNTCIQRVRLGYARILLGAYAEAAAVLRDALATAERLGLPKVIALAQHNLGLALAYAGDVDGGRKAEQAAIEAYAAQGDRRLEGASRGYLTLIELKAGDLTAAEREARLSVAIQKSTPPLVAYARACLAQVLLGQGKTAEALAEAGEAYRVLREIGKVEEGDALIRLTYARALLAAGQDARAVIEDAQKHVREAAEKIRDPELRRSFLENDPDNERTLAL
jgi:tetratricopeptide (TPR) repeat protein